jgi:hypothetical protein
VSRAGLVPVMALAQRAGLAGLVAEHVRPGGPCGVNAELKIPCLVAGMVAGADSIDDMDLLRHGAMPDLFGGIRAPSTLGSHLRSFTWGNVRQPPGRSQGRAGLRYLRRRAPPDRVEGTGRRVARIDPAAQPGAEVVVPVIHRVPPARSSAWPAPRTGRP